MGQSNTQPIGNLMAQMKKKIWAMPPDFEDTTLTPDEAAYALYDARCEKYYAEKEQKAKAAKALELSNCLQPFTTDGLKEFVLKENPKFIVDKQNEKAFTQLCQYFTNNPAFEENGFSLSKGILLTGPVGVGKTELLRVFSKNKRQCFHLISVFEIEVSCQQRGVEFFKAYTGMVPGWGNTSNFFYQKNIGWAFDDIGRESVVFDFGNKSDVVSKIIQTRYADKNKLPFSTLHLTTNLTPAEIESRYDYAVKSRLREMFNYILVGGKDRR